MRNAESHDLTQGGILKKLIVFFLPVAAGTIVQQLYNTVDALIVSKYVGTAALAAVGGSTTQIINLLIGFFVALTSGASVVVAHFYGEKNDEGVGRASGTAIVLCTIIGLCVTAIGELCAPVFLGWMDTPAETVAQATEYLRIVFSAVVFVLIYNMGAGILRASGDSQRPFYYLLACCVCNIVMDYVLVKICGMGVAGAAIATAASQMISCVLVIIRLTHADESYRLKKVNLRLTRSILRRMLKIGIPSGLQQTMFGFSNAVIQTGVNSLGTTVVAAWSLTGKIDGIYWAIISAAGVSVMNFVGQNYGAGRMDRVRECVKLSMKVFSAVTVVMSAALLAIGRPAILLFTDDQALMEKTWEIMLYFVPYYFTWTFIEVISGTLKGAGDAIVPVIILGLGICGFRILWVLVVFGLIYHSLIILGLSYVTSWVITDIALIIRYVQWSKKHREKAVS
ncbi:MAG: MATE family efflux transporter [Firmicutes bacterium]|nr:MATE family efflux transporter [Bacillota bacterium]